jgi:hypothetical protein
MSFESKFCEIIKNVTKQEMTLPPDIKNLAMLYPISFKCKDNPTRGITVKIQGAENVIRDCANVASNFIPHMIVASLDILPQSCCQNIEKDAVEEFINKIDDGKIAKQLFDSLIAMIPIAKEEKPAVIKKQTASDSVYGDYLDDEDAAVSEAAIELDPKERFIKFFAKV